MAGFEHGAGCHGMVHVPMDIGGHARTNKTTILTKHDVALFSSAGTWLAHCSPSLLIQPYQLLGENHV
jgi:hypothetical protein